MDRSTPTYNVLGRLSRSGFSPKSLIAYFLLLGAALYGIVVFVQVLSSRDRLEHELSKLRQSNQELQLEIGTANMKAKADLNLLNGCMNQLKDLASVKKKPPKKSGHGFQKSTRRN